MTDPDDARGGSADTVTDTGPDARAGTATDAPARMTQQRTESGTESEADARTEREAGADTESEADARTESEADARTESGTGADAVEPAGAAAERARRRLAADARRLLLEWTPPSAEQEAARAEFLAFVDEHRAAAVDRDLRVGHLTASTVLLDHDRERVLLTLHPLVGGWVQLGGHFEPVDASTQGAAAREVAEESGIVGSALHSVPIGLDRHDVTCRDSRRRRSPSVHFDVTFLAVAPAGAEPRISDESLDLRWFPLDALPDEADRTLRTLVARVRSLD